MKKMYIEHYPSENDRQSLFPERSLIIILVLVFMFVVLVVVVAVMGSSYPSFIRPATEGLPTPKKAVSPTAVTSSLATVASTVKSFFRNRHWR